MLGHGEYNINYLFRHPGTGDKLVLRLPMGSQMHLDNQVRYEYEALRLLQSEQAQRDLRLRFDEILNDLKIEGASQRAAAAVLRELTDPAA